MGRLISYLSKLKSPVDRADIFILVGLCFTFKGFHLFRPWLAYLAVGVILTGLGILGAIRETGERK